MYVYDRNWQGFTLSLLLKVLFQQFRFFLNLYFLVIALTQFIPTLRIGFLYTYWGPLVSQSVENVCISVSLSPASPPSHLYTCITHNHLPLPPPLTWRTAFFTISSLTQCFVLAVTMARELYDDFKRFLRDMEVNAQKFTKLTTKGWVVWPWKSLHVSQISPPPFPLFTTLPLHLPLSTPPPLSCSGPESVKSKDIQVSDIIIVEKVHVLTACLCCDRCAVYTYNMHVFSMRMCAAHCAHIDTIFYTCTSQH